MSPGAIAVAGIIVNGTVDLAVVGTIGWLIYTKRILFAATPKPQKPEAGQ